MRPTITILCVLAVAAGTTVAVGRLFTANDTPSALAVPSERVVTVAGGEPLGPVNIVDGVSHGWRYDIDGATAAAAAALRLTGRIARAGFISRSDIITSLASTRFASTLIDRTSAQLAGFADALSASQRPAAEVLLEEFPLTVVAQAGDGDHVTVRIWSVVVYGLRGVGVAQQAWRTVTVGLVWERNDWRIDAWDVLSGPTPGLAAQAAVSTVDEVSDSASARDAGVVMR